MPYPVSFASNYNNYQATRDVINRQRAGETGALDALKQSGQLREEMRAFLDTPFLQVMLDGREFTFTGKSLLAVFDVPRSRSRHGDIGNELISVMKLNDPALQVRYLPKKKTWMPGSKPYYKASQLTRLKKRDKLLPVLARLLNEKVNLATQYGLLRTDWQRFGLMRSSDRLFWSLTPQGKAATTGQG